VFVVIILLAFVFAVVVEMPSSLSKIPDVALVSTSGDGHDRGLTWVTP
jgi:hypothetical protein